MPYESLTCTIADGVAEVTVNRPDKLNALNAATIAELDGCLAGLAADPAVRAVILTGAGEKAFVAGADIGELADLAAAAAERLAARGQALMDRIENLGKPVIAAVNGFALGGGCELAMACTFRYAADTARLGLPETGLGLIPGYGGTQRLPRLVGRGRALELILTGDMIDAAEALGLGLVNKVVPAAELMAATRAVAAAPGPAVAPDPAGGAAGGQRGAGHGAGRRVPPGGGALRRVRRLRGRPRGLRRVPGETQARLPGRAERKTLEIWMFVLRNDAPAAERILWVRRLSPTIFGTSANALSFPREGIPMTENTAVDVPFMEVNGELCKGCQLCLGGLPQERDRHQREAQQRQLPPGLLHGRRLHRLRPLLLRLPRAGRHPRRQALGTQPTGEGPWPDNS